MREEVIQIFGNRFSFNITSELTTIPNSNNKRRFLFLFTNWLMIGARAINGTRKLYLPISLFVCVFVCLFVSSCCLFFSVYLSIGLSVNFLPVSLDLKIDLENWSEKYPKLMDNAVQIHLSKAWKFLRYNYKLFPNYISLFEMTTYLQ